MRTQFSVALCRRSPDDDEWMNEEVFDASPEVYFFPRRLLDTWLSSVFAATELHVHPREILPLLLSHLRLVN